MVTGTQTLSLSSIARTEAVRLPQACSAKLAQAECCLLGGGTWVQFFAVTTVMYREVKSLGARHATDNQEEKSSKVMLRLPHYVSDALNVST